MSNLFIADSYNSRIRKVSSSGLITTVAGDGFRTACYAGEGGPATGGVLTMPLAVTVDGTGNIYVAATGDFEDQAYDDAVNCSSIRILRPSSSSVLPDSVRPNRFRTNQRTGCSPAISLGLRCPSVASRRLSFIRRPHRWPR